MMQDTIMRNKYLIRFLTLFVLLTIGYSCGNKSKAPDVKHISDEVVIRRFEKDLFDLTSGEIQWDELVGLRNKYGDFYDLYMEKIANIARADDTAGVVYIRDFLNDPDMKSIYAETQKIFGDFSSQESKLRKALQYYRYYFPDHYVPQVITYFFGFNYAMVATDSAACIALDQYLGKDFKYYNHLPDYIRARKDPAYLVTDLMRGWAMTEFERNEPRVDLLDEMIFQGKIMYFLEHILPFEHDSILIGYSQKQLTFCKENEWNIWSYFVENKLLYSKNLTNISKYTGEAPFSAGMPREAPGRTGVWTGWQIVKAYAKNNKKATLQEIMNEHDYKKILNKSNYKPKR
jgi:gliding motility-associated lipoprotein GldB